MIAAILVVAFVTATRAAGILQVPRRGVTWIKGLREWKAPVHLPSRYSGALLLIPARKTRQNRPSWVPLRKGRPTSMLRRHIRWMRSKKVKCPFLFPARVRVLKGKRRAWYPFPHNQMSTSSLRTLTRMALTEVCGLSRRQAMLFSAHSLRVGGLNFYRQLGASLDMRAQLADHASIDSARRYLRLRPAEQFGMIDRILRRGRSKTPDV